MIVPWRDDGSSINLDVLDVPAVPEPSGQNGFVDWIVGFTGLDEDGVQGREKEKGLAL